MKKLMMIFGILILILTGCGTVSQSSASPTPAKAKSAATTPPKKIVTSQTPVKSTQNKGKKTTSQTLVKPAQNKEKTTSQKSSKPVKKMATKSAVKKSVKKTAVKKVTAPTLSTLSATKLLYIAVANAYVHRSPGLQSTNLTVLQKNVKLEAKQTSEIEGRLWYGVTFNDGQKGWISSAVVTTKKPAVPTKKPSVKPASSKLSTPQSTPAPTPKKPVSYIDKLLAKAHQNYNSSQAMIVTASSAASYHATLNGYAYQNGKWSRVFSMPAAIGKYGITFDMHEGGLKSPAGIYYIGRAFGELPKPSGVSLSYTQTTTHDYWIDDPTSPDYNQWKVYSGNPHNKWKSFERLRIPQYKYAAVIEYNTHPIVKGKGSAIFLHVWSGPYSPTAGCTAVAENNMVSLLRWMNPSLHPVIIQGTVGQLEAISN